MSSRGTWVGIVFVVALLAWAAWSLFGGAPGSPETDGSVGGVTPPAVVDEPIEESLPASSNPEPDRAPAGLVATVVEPTRARIAVLVLAKGTGAPVPGVTVGARATVPSIRSAAAASAPDRSDSTELSRLSTAA